MRYREITARARLASISIVTCMLMAYASVGTGAGVGVGADVDAQRVDDPVVAGERLYREGVTVAGDPVHGISQGDVPVSGRQAACVNCHRRSGLGSSEGGYYAPPINAPLLYAPRKLDRQRLFTPMYRKIQPDRYAARLHQPRMRPAYTLGSLGTTLRGGADAAGAPLATIMPRYQLTDADVAALDAYLHTLSAHVDPGVDQREVRLATVFSANVPAAERAAMLSTLQAYIKWRNEHLAYNVARPGFSINNRSEFIATDRKLALAVWDLQGEESTWQAQLDQHYQANPVYALVGGVVHGSWNGPAKFCDGHRIPCLFPDTELPAWPASAHGYTMYFSAGLVLEAKTVATFIARNDARQQRIVQIAADDSFGQVPAKVFQQALDAQNAHGAASRTITFRDRAELDAALRANGSDAKQTLIVWPGNDAKMVLDALVANKPQASQIILPSRAISTATSMQSGELASRLRFANPYELKPASHYKIFETRAWLRTRGLGRDYPNTRLKAFYAMSLLNAAVTENRDDYYRDYLLERMEDVSQNDMNPGMYPALALGPGDRYAAKGAKIVRLDPEQPGTLVAISDWIAP